MIRKRLLLPYFGQLPPWMDLWHANAARLRDHGYDWIIDTDEAAFRMRVRRVLGIECPPMHGTGKTWDFRPTLGVLYADELRGYDFWGHTDFDCVYGRVERWVTDEFLDDIDMHSNCSTYLNGCWSLYRNTPIMNELFRGVPSWRETLEDPEPSGWGETSVSQRIAAMHDAGEIKKAWTQWQVYTDQDLELVRLDGDRLMCDEEEVMMCHFRRTKVYPEGALR